VLSLKPDAAELFLQWREKTEPWLGADGDFETMKDWGGKFPGLTARLAGNLHLIRFDTLIEPIGIESVRSAIEISKWAIPHARAAFGLLGADDGTMADAERILRWLEKCQKTQTTQRDVHQQFRYQFDDDRKRLESALELLIERGWLRPIENTQSGPGRKSKQFDCHPWVVNPPRISGEL